MRGFVSGAAADAALETFATLQLHARATTLEGFGRAHFSTVLREFAETLQDRRERKT